MTEHENLFSDAERWQSWLDVEAALASVQADLKIIPAWAAKEIKKKAKIDNFDANNIASEIERTGSPVFALVRIFANFCGTAGHYVHLGATTQNIVETGQLIVLKRYHKILLKACIKILEKLKIMALEHADTMMVGRTQGNHALPITFGYKLAGWINDFISLVDRFFDIERRLFLLRFGGAVGAFHGFGSQGQKVSEALATKLDMDLALFQGRNSPEGQLEYILALCAIGQLVSKISNELYFLNSEGIDEICERLNHKTVGSSTMPHKVNAKRLLSLRSDSSILTQKMSAVMGFTNPQNEGDASSNNEISAMFSTTCPAAIDLLHDFRAVLDNININKEIMKKNVRLTQYFTASEALQIQLASHIGKFKAHQIVHKISLKSKRNPEVFFQLLQKHPEIKRFFSKKALFDILKAENNLGDSAKLARMASELAYKKIGEISKVL